MYHELESDMSMMKNYFGSGHGKGEVDGCGALLKQEIWKEEMNPFAKKIQNAHDVVQYLLGQ